MSQLQPALSFRVARDDEDAGDVIIYTGHGGQDKFNRQCAHQKLEGGNLALERSMHYGIEVRVIRGIKFKAVFQSGQGTGCDCVDGCSGNCFCAMKNGGEFAYDQNGFLLKASLWFLNVGPSAVAPTLSESCHTKRVEK
ncbi:hypothetical protein Pyn_29464 [Prunus yedoensis var. nudiflora]|uniref:YDG domain-containing protein n=1 Tax=Prunus yedoensis var. nudiflora TaxID=2094558 RepID=A0A314UF23_PRUYE|nr:hypothetical protein Pyn_29464 [Prunus yedoensis var. nudiflora]